MSVENFNLTPMEIVFLLVAVLVTVPLVIFVRYVLKELKKESSK